MGNFKVLDSTIACFVQNSEKSWRNIMRFVSPTRRGDAKKNWVPIILKWLGQRHKEGIKDISSLCATEVIMGEVSISTGP